MHVASRASPVTRPNLAISPVKQGGMAPVRDVRREIAGAHLSFPRRGLSLKSGVQKWIKKTPARARQDTRSYLNSRSPGSLDSWDSLEGTDVEHELGSSLRRPEIYGSTEPQRPRLLLPQYPSGHLSDVVHGLQSDEFYETEPAPALPITLDSRSDSADVLLTWCADFIFRHGFGAIFGRWVGRYGCPFVDEPTSGVCIPPTKLFGDLDAFMDEQLDADPRNTSTATSRRQERNSQIDRSLRRAMQSYAARWLPILMQRNPAMTMEYEPIIRDYWRATRRDMLKVINRTAYRSVLTLYLFSQTPVPVGVTDEEEQDGLSGVVCTQTALLQLQQLRDQLRSCRFKEPQISDRPNSVTAPSNISSLDLTQSYLDLESRAYWAAITWDTFHSSMTLNYRSFLSSGLKGACLETPWRLARAFLVGSFPSRTEDWRKRGFEVSDEVAPQVISAAAVCSVYTWRTIASVKEALRECVEEESVLFAWEALLDALDIFRTTIHPLMENCQRRLDFLDQVNRLYWYEIALHYYLGILILVDCLDTANRSDLLSQLADTKVEAEHECFNVLKFGVESSITVDGLQTDSHGTSSSRPSTVDLSATTITTSLVAIDPYPHHVVASVRLLNKAIGRKYRQGSIKHETYSHLSSTLLKALKQLPQSSKTVRVAREDLNRSIYDFNDLAVSGGAKEPGLAAGLQVGTLTV